MEFALCIVPAAPVREKASHKSEMTNQLLFGEAMEVLRVKKEEWFQIRSLHDKYEGYLRSNQVMIIEKDVLSSLTPNVVTDLTGTVFIDHQPMLITAGSQLPGYDNGYFYLGDREYHFEGNCYRVQDLRPNTELLLQLTQSWMHAPYMWGGRTPMGVDASGFIQVIYKMLGVNLWRDAYLQSEQGIKINDLQDVQCGDLAFFSDRKNRIRHVGILLNDREILHAYGMVRIDKITEDGIIDSITGVQTHQLKDIRRYW